ncbi:hypothetical protein [Actinospica robiniae]|uniref:hypothetical protein n=1 Tax=Actinospica robiniae TaxID=304901 RepID=UPI0004211833|nr:hypothetical protein [Actinospica robiniae]
MGGRWFVERTQTAARRALFGRTICTVADYIGGASPRQGAQVYALNHRTGDFAPHTHPVAQFRILWAHTASPDARPADAAVRDDGAVPRFLVCFTDAHTAGEALTPAEPLRSLTLRVEPTDAIRFPGLDQDVRIAPDGRALHARAETGADAVEAGTLRRRVLLEDPADELRASLVDAGPGTGIPLLADARGHRFAVVLAGDVLVQEAETRRRYSPQSVSWQPPGSEAVSAEAGDAGASILVLGFPVSKPWHRAAAT